VYALALWSVGGGYSSKFPCCCCSAAVRALFDQHQHPKSRLSCRRTPVGTERCSELRATSLARVGQKVCWSLGSLRRHGSLRRGGLLLSMTARSSCLAAHIRVSSTVTAACYAGTRWGIYTAVSSTLHLARRSLSILDVALQGQRWLSLVNAT